MKIGGKDIVREQDTFRLLRRNGEVIEIAIRALGPDFGIQTARELPAPRPPFNYARDKDGEILKGRDGKPQRVYDDNDSAYLRALTEHNILFGVAVMWAGTVEGSVEWDTRREDYAPGKERDFYRALLAEMAGSGISNGDFGQWILAIKRLSSVTEEDVEAAKSSFQDAGREADAAV